MKKLLTVNSVSVHHQRHESRYVIYCWCYRGKKKSVSVGLTSSITFGVTDFFFIKTVSNYTYRDLVLNGVGKKKV